MSSLNLNNAKDFAKLTLSNASQVLVDLAGRDAAKWDIVEGAFNGVKFHIFESNENLAYKAALSQITDKGGRRKVKYSMPYKDGQTTDDLGRKAFTFDVDILLFGDQYLAAMKKLFIELDKPTPGKLTHPIRGDIIVAVEDYDLIHSNEKRKAVALRLQFAEHNFTIGDIRKLKDPTVKGALTKALAAFGTIAAAITKVQGAVTFVQAVKNDIVAALTAYNTNYATNLQKLNVTFNGGSSADIPGLLPTSQGGLRNTDGSLASRNFPVAGSPNDPFVNLPLNQLSNQTTQAVATLQAVNDINTMRDQLTGTLKKFRDQGAEVDFHDEIVGLKNTALLIQDALDKGIASSKLRIINFVTPHTMSIREVAFANGLTLSQANDLDILNPFLDSVNFIPKGTQLQVPVSV